MADLQQPSASALTILVQLEAMARGAESVQALRFLAVNETRRLVPYRQGFCFAVNRKPGAGQQLVAASSLSNIDRHAPMVVWLEAAVAAFAAEDAGQIRQLDKQLCPAHLQPGWDEFSLPFMLWCPLRLPNGALVGGLMFGRETPWIEQEQILLKRLADTYAHALGALNRGFRHRRSYALHNRYVQVGLGLVLLMLLLPVRMSALAPAEVVAREPAIVSAPMDGVIAQIMQPPNRKIAQGDVLFRFEDTNLRNRFQIAERQLQVAQAELRTAGQSAFSSQESKSQIALLRTRVARQQAERDYAQELLNQVDVRAVKNGLLLYNDQSDWIGRPVLTGERIMQIADPGQVQVRLDLAVADAIVLKPGARVKIFLDKDPLNPLDGVLVRTSYNATPTPERTLAYRLDADFIVDEEPNGDPAPLPRIGLQGTGKVYGERVTLFFYLFRRPLATVRQFIGF